MQITTVAHEIYTQTAGAQKGTIYDALQAITRCPHPLQEAIYHILNAAKEHGAKITITKTTDRYYTTITLVFDRYTYISLHMGRSGDLYVTGRSTMNDPPIAEWIRNSRNMQATDTEIRVGQERIKLPKKKDGDPLLAKLCSQLLIILV